MSQYGPPPDDPNQPQDPYGAPPPSQNPPQDPYGAPPPQTPYGGSPNPYGGSSNTYGGSPTQYGGVPSASLAGWLSRVGASVIDALVALVAGLPLWIGYGILIANTDTTTDANGVTHTEMHGGGAAAILILIGVITYLAFWIWNVCIKQGRTGQTIGKGVLAIKLIGRDGQPIGGGLCFVRQIAHVLDGICYIGYLWPLWDSQKQTFADKIMGTHVIHATNPVG